MESITELMEIFDWEEFHQELPRQCTVRVFHGMLWLSYFWIGTY
jgi:hypothetical protein